MSTGASQQDDGPDDGLEDLLADTDTDAPPLAADRPYVDGASLSSQQLRAEVERLSQEDRQHVDDLREEVGDSLADLAARFDVKARVTERRDEAVASVAQQVDRARTAVAGGAVAAKDTARQKPGAVAAVGAAVAVLLVILLRRRRG